MNPGTSIYDVRKWRKAKQARIKALRIKLRDLERELENLMEAERNLAIIEDAKEILAI